MNFLRLLVLLCVGYGGYHYWQQHQTHKQLQAATNSNGFVELPASPDGQDSGTVYVVAAENCPHEEAQRADRLAKELSNQNISVQRTHHISFSTLTEASQAERVSAVMNGELPIVFINGRAKSNPSLDEVLKEVRGK